MDLTTKFKLDGELPLWLISLGVDFSTFFPGIEVKDSLPRQPKAQQIVFVAANSHELHHLMPKVDAALAKGGVVWAIYPKKSGKFSSDIHTYESWDGVMQMGFRILGDAAIDNDWTAARMKRTVDAPVKNGLAPVEERKVPGIDFIARTVTLPTDAIKSMKPYKGIADYFNSLSFSHKKEHVMAIEEAKKPETRQKRIDKMIEMLQQQMAAKAKT